MMKQHTTTLFALTNLHKHDFSYCFVETDLQKFAGKEDLYTQQKLKIAQKIASKISGPAIPIVKNTRLYIAVPADCHLESCKIDVVPFVVQVKLLPQVYKVSIQDDTPEAISIIIRFLEFAISRSLGNNNQLWKLNARQFFKIEPVKMHIDSDVEIFGGFDYEVIRLEDQQYYVTLDITYKYISKTRLSEQLTLKNARSVQNWFKGRRFLYQNGTDWYTIEVEGFGKTISEQEFSKEGKSYLVLDYIQSKFRQRRQKVPFHVKPDDISIFYKYPNRNMAPYAGAASFARMIFSTNDFAVAGLHGFSIKKPDVRFDSISNVISQFFQNILFNNKLIQISKTAKVEEAKVFPMPALLYSNEQVLKAGHYSAGGNVSLKHFGEERMQYLLDNGILNNAPFDNQYLIVPDSMDRNLVAAFQRNIECQLKKLAPAFSRFKTLRYRSKAPTAATYQIQEIEKLLRTHEALNGFALFILPDATFTSKQDITTFHDCLKSKFYPNLKVQCASENKVSRFFHSFSTLGQPQEYRVPEFMKGKFRSYINYLVCEHLIINRKWPYALANNLNYDVYIGIDVHGRHAGFTFFFKNGRHIFFTSVHVPKKPSSQRAEKLRAKLLYDVLYGKLKELIPEFAPNPNGIVIVRDGRSYGEEGKALDMVIDSLQKNGIAQPTIRRGVIDLYKQSTTPFRLAYKVDGHTNLDNPAAGAYRLFQNTQEAFLFNTGFPFNIRGTAKPLHLRRTSGDVEFVKVLEDLFHQSMLAFSAPDRSNSLPIVLKLIDTMLEPLAVLSDGIETDDDVDELVAEY